MRDKHDESWLAYFERTVVEVSVCPLRAPSEERVRYLAMAIDRLDEPLRSLVIESLSTRTFIKQTTPGPTRWTLGDIDLVEGVG